MAGGKGVIGRGQRSGKAGAGARMSSNQRRKKVGEEGERAG